MVGTDTPDESRSLCWTPPVGLSKRCSHKYPTDWKKHCERVSSLCRKLF